MSKVAILGLLVHLLCLSCVGGEGPDNHGREFILSFMNNLIQPGYDSNDIELFFTTVSNTDAQVNITTPTFNNTFFEQIYASRGEIIMVTVPYTIRGAGTELAYKTVHIEASEEIVVYGVNKEKWSTDAYVGIPVDAVGKEYYVMTYYTQAEFSIAAIYDSTEITITFSNPQNLAIYVNYNGVIYRNNDVLTLTMNRFQAFHCYQNGFLADFTGTHIESSQPVTVVSGNKKVAVDYTGTSSDHLTEILFPVECWGREYFSYSTPDRTLGDIMRILASVDGTTVQITQSTGTFSISLNAGQFQEYDVATDSLLTITSDNGITVGIFAKTFNNDGPNYGDPAFSFLIPSPLFASDYTYSTIKLPNGNDFSNKLTMIIHEDDTSGLRLDESTISVTWAEVPGSNGYVTGWLYVTPGSHNIYHTDPAKTFMSIATGTEQFNSYAFSSGQRMTQINVQPCIQSSPQAGDILDNDCDGSVDEETANSIDDDGDGLIDEDLALPPRINGEWGEWGNWSGCSITCLQIGQRVRTRPCDNPEPANNGIYCVGDGSEYMDCDNRHVYCGIWQEWTEWSPCSVTCNDGVRNRERNCTDVVTWEPGDCGPGDYNETEICDVGPLQGVCYNNVTGNCSYCDWGYTGSQCDWCVANYTGCYCEYCRDNLIGYDTNCSTPCYHGYASLTGGDICECHVNTTMGFWQEDDCTECLDGFVLPDCTDCGQDWVGDGHCSIPCFNNGTLLWDYDGTTDDLEVVPDFSCVVSIAGGYVNAWYGYSSFNSKIVRIPVGSDNLVVGAVALLQETEFRPGYHQYAFQVGPIRVGDSATWTLAYEPGGSNYTVGVPTLNPRYCNDTEEKWNLAEIGLTVDTGYCKCASGYHGASCQHECPGGSDNPCSHNGECRRTDGICVCQSRWAGEDYDLDLYTEGYVSSDPAYSCGNCTTDFYGDDCSTARLTRYVNGSGYYATAFSSEVITLDGATLTLVEPGAYRLLQTDDITMDGLYVPCIGRHDCHSLREVAFTYNNVTLSIAVDDNGLTSINASETFDTAYPLTYTSGNLTASGIVNDVIRYVFEDGTEIVVSNIQGELVVGVVVPQNHTGVTGLLGNADGDWVNDVSMSANQASFSSSDLTADQKAVDANSRFKLNTGNTVLLQSDLTETLDSGGFALMLAYNSTGGNVSGISLEPMDQFSLELWTKIPETSSNTAVLSTMDTSLGPLELSVVNGLLAVDWAGTTFSTSVVVDADTWTYVSVNWENVDGNVTVMAMTPQSGSPTTVLSDIQSSFNGGSSMTSMTSLFLGGGDTDTEMYLDYIRLFDKSRSSSEMDNDFEDYTDKLITDQRLVILFDEGQGTTFTTHVNAWNMDTAYTGTLDNGATWPYSSIPVNDILITQALASVISDAAAAAACAAELNSTLFTSNCNSFGAVRQLVMENCIRDYTRTNNSNIVKLSGSAFAHYCQGITQTPACDFSSYLDFCASSSSSSAGDSSAIIMAAAGGAGVLLLAAIAACCCCCLKAIIGRKKIRDDDDEEEEEEEEELEEPPPIQDTTSTTGLKPSPPVATMTGVAMISPAILKMRQPGKMSLPPEKPFEPLHPGRWTGYGWLPGARPVDGVSSMPPDELERQKTSLDGDLPGSGAPTPAPHPSSATPRPSMGSIGRTNTLTSINLSVDSAREPSNLAPVTATCRD